MQQGLSVAMQEVDMSATSTPGSSAAFSSRSRPCPPREHGCGTRWPGPLETPPLPASVTEPGTLPPAPVEAGLSQSRGDLRLKDLTSCRNRQAYLSRALQVHHAQSSPWWVSPGRYAVAPRPATDPQLSLAAADAVGPGWGLRRVKCVLLAQWCTSKSVVSRCALGRCDGNCRRSGCWRRPSRS